MVHYIAKYYVIYPFTFFQKARSHQLLMHNRDMLDQMAQLVARLQELELKVTGAVRTADVESLLPPPPALRVRSACYVIGKQVSRARVCDN